MFKKIALIAMMAFSLSLSTTAFATEINTPVINTDTVQELSVSQMVDELYQNEKSETVKQLAHDLILTITGEKEPAHVYASGLVEIGTYPRDYHGDANTAVSLIGGGRLTATRTDTTFTIFLDRGDKLTDDFFNKCKADLRSIYDKVKEVKTATASMDQQQKVQYIAQYVAGAFTYDYVDHGNLTSALNTGVSNCEWYASYFYILASNCGIDTSCRTGMNSRNNYHAWNTVVIDGQELVVDVSSGDYNNRMDLFVLIPTSEYPGVEKYDTWSVI